MYDDVLDDPKVQRLPPDLFKAWVNLLCLASRNDGVLPSIDDMSFALRMSQDVTRDMVRDLSQRGLIDECDGLSPHNWNARQFKSDKDDNAAERKRAQRKREKERENTDVMPDVTRDMSVTSRPPEQNRTEQSRAEQSARAQDEPRHSKVAQDYLASRGADLTEWEVQFLISIKWEPTLTKAQTEKLKAIEDKLGKAEGLKPQSLPTVARGTPAFEAWLAYYRRRNGGRKTFYEGRDTLTVPTEWPPIEEAA